MTQPALIASALPERRRVALLAALALVPLAPVYFGVGVAGVVGAVFLAALAVVTVKDLEERRIPNAIVLPTTALVFAATAALHPDRALESAVAAVGAAAFLLLPGLLARGAVGMGDVKLALLLGAALGRGVVSALLLGCAAASVAGIVLLVRHGAGARKRALPFAPFLTFGAIAALVLGAPHVL
jgi:leader peptidase (prepilin peptidase) / N-methyltransferase